MIVEIASVYRDRGSTILIRLTNGKTIIKRDAEIRCHFDPDLRGNSAGYDPSTGQIIFSSAVHRDECVRLWNQCAQPKSDHANSCLFEPLHLPEPEHPATA